MNISNIEKEILEECYENNLAEYNEIIKNNIFTWDIVVITASNEQQLMSFKNEINYMKQKLLIPSNIDYVFISDLEGKRIGSGGATLNVINYLFNTYSNLLNKKILLMHSGGDSKRSPNFSSCGKIFSPVPRKINGYYYDSLFLENMILFCTIPKRMDPGIFIISGDMLLVFDPLQIDLKYKKSCVVSIFENINLGPKHGVFVESNNRVIKFLHKNSVDSLAKNNAIENNLINIDTGIVYFSYSIIKELYDFISNDNNFVNIINEDVRINLYGDLVFSMAQKSTLEQYINEPAEVNINNKIISARKKIWKILHDKELNIIKMNPAVFSHFGSTIEYLNLVTGNNFKYLQWKRQICSHYDSNRAVLINSTYLGNDSGQKVYAENSVIKNCKIGSNVIISNSNIIEKEIPPNICISTLILDSNKYVSRIYSVFDNPKETIKLDSMILNAPINKAIKKYNTDIKSFLGNESTLWDAKIYVIAKNMEESIKSALIFYNICHCKSSNEEFDTWNKLNKTSLKDSFNNTNCEQMIEYKNTLILSNYCLSIISEIREKNLNNIINSLTMDNINQDDFINWMLNNLHNYDLSIQMRIYYILSKISSDGNKYEDKIFDIVKKFVSKNYYVKHKKISATKDIVKVKLPLRINFAGGWSDTPPYCYEHGGNVLNASIKVKDKYPIKVSIQKVLEKKIIIESLDYASQIEISSIEDIKNCSDPNDPFALQKCAIIISGIVQENDENFSSVYERLGCGFKIASNVEGIPRGSGLGTSSILSAAILKALYKFIGIKIVDAKLCDNVLRLEQLMSTGGGWQDQVGGVIKGIKLISSNPGNVQKLEINKPKLSKETIKELNDRMLLIYSGQRRLARNLLRNIVKKYISNDPTTLKSLTKIQEIAVQMVNSLESGNIVKFSELMNEHMLISRKIDKGCVNEGIMEIINSIKKLVLSTFIMGAGGGGYILIMLKDGYNSDDIDSILEKKFPNTNIKSLKISIES